MSSKYEVGSSKGKRLIQVVLWLIVGLAMGAVVCQMIPDGALLQCAVGALAVALIIDIVTQDLINGGQRKFNDVQMKIYERLTEDIICLADRIDALKNHLDTEAAIIQAARMLQFELDIEFRKLEAGK